MILLPWPKRVQEGNGYYQLGFDTMIVMKPSCPEGAAVYAQMLKDEIASCTGMGLQVTRGCAGAGDIRLCVDGTMWESRYLLDVAKDGVAICGGSLAAMGQGVQTLRQLFRQYAGLLPAVHMEDEQDFKVRGFFHDVTRGRVQTLSNLKKMVDTMVFYKLNQLQLYIEHTYLFRGMTELWRDETPLTAGEILELDAYCAERGVELVPALASFGHLYKLLGTRTYAGLCELEDSVGQEFSFWDRMEHHTLNAADERSAGLAIRMIGEYMQLFRSDKFNICADETFDLGTGRSRAVAKEKGRDVLYAEFVSKLFDFLIENGKTPMFWGDMICESPKLLERFPKEVVCLAWGYSETEPDTQVRVLHEAGTKLYVCPGTRGWNHFVNQMEEGYENIKRMCAYGRKYHALGVLNTDWGDYGHVGHPDFSVPGMIYGAVFSWGKTELSFDELNRMVSELEFGDASGAFVGCLAKVGRLSVFGWARAVQLKEWSQKKRETKGLLEDLCAAAGGRFGEVKEQGARLEMELSAICRSMDRKKRRILACAQLSLRIIAAWNAVGEYLLARMGGLPAGQGRVRAEQMPVWQDEARREDVPTGWQNAGRGAMLAQELEQCLYYYKEFFRENSKEGDLAKVSDVFFWYADLLREEGQEDRKAL